MAKKTDKVQELEQRISDLENQLKRAVADYHNLEKRVAEGRSELTKWGTGELLVKLLPVLDHLEQVVDHGRPTLSEQNESKGWFQGVELAVKEFKGVLQSEGLSEIATDGQFDPGLHEAVDIQEGDDNIILRVVRRGYRLNGKVLRPAHVVVGRKNPPAMEETENLPGGETQSE
ncbi:nucleotide exchange factor GrpE [Candidatus Daviesbacteria bacterium RIFCSPHIGHO2_02_FULL_39_12]|uniref:Protein GrpE n=2 Tax=Candidatus Daviesiibacteriota TaxID=1752718 RepID=A0A1F5JE02_9BACT|nr:MAG: nucleotide exchange factor GrpE [Candidatus Daviesbacteria bacterium RIFCSPHIGHO2_02_FULL_39_12]OGE71466.1 MAG: nucleotide exchange factor GrpE [Candidatus Daviesbacteria bacterium RIFCSPLOWO2_02_FULL_38_15]